MNPHVETYGRTSQNIPCASQICQNINLRSYVSEENLNAECKMCVTSDMLFISVPLQNVITFFILYIIKKYGMYGKM